MFSFVDSTKPRLTLLHTCSLTITFLFNSAVTQKNESEKLFLESRKEIKPEVMILYAAYCTMAAKSLMMVADFTEQKKEEWLYPF